MFHNYPGPLHHHVVFLVKKQQHDENHIFQSLTPIRVTEITYLFHIFPIKDICYKENEHKLQCDIFIALIDNYFTWAITFKYIWSPVISHKSLKLIKMKGNKYTFQFLSTTCTQCKYVCILSQETHCCFTFFFYKSYLIFGDCLYLSIVLFLINICKQMSTAVLSDRFIWQAAECIASFLS